MNPVKSRVVLSRVLGTIIIPVAIYIVLLTITGGRFGQPSSLLMVSRLSVIPILIALAMGCNMTIGMWDFSIGGIIYAAAILGAKITAIAGAGIVGLIVFVAAIAMGLSLLNGLLYRIMKIPSLVLTVGTLMLYEALPRIFGIQRVQIAVTDGVLSQTPWCFMVLAALLVLFYIVFNKTAFGYGLKAIGANQTIANNAGIDLVRIKFKSFLFGGIFTSFAAILYLSNMNTMTAPVSMGSISLIFDAMMGVFIAFFLNRYCNFVVGIVIGAFCMQMLTSGLVAMGLETTVRSAVSGIFLLVLLIISSNQGTIAKISRQRQLARRANDQYNMLHSGKISM